MKIREKHPDIAGDIPLSLFIQKVDKGYLLAQMDEIATYYSEHLPLWQVLNHYGLDVDPDTDKQYVHCVLPEHGGEDRHASASYFRYDRNSGGEEPKFYCFKCEKALSSLWFVVHMLKAQGRSLFAAFEEIANIYSIPFPRDLILEMDAESLIANQESTQEAKRVRIQRAIALRPTLLRGDRMNFLGRLHQILRNT